MSTYLHMYNEREYVLCLLAFQPLRHDRGDQKVPETHKLVNVLMILCRAALKTELETQTFSNHLQKEYCNDCQVYNSCSRCYITSIYQPTLCPLGPGIPGIPGRPDDPYSREDA